MVYIPVSSNLELQQRIRVTWGDGSVEVVGTDPAGEVCKKTNLSKLPGGVR